MNDSFDIMTLAIRSGVLLVVAGIFFFVLTRKKEDKK
jgi:hypothetical protein